MTTAKLVIDNLTKSFDGQHLANNHISLEIDAARNITSKNHGFFGTQWSWKIYSIESNDWFY